MSIAELIKLYEYATRGAMDKWHRTSVRKREVWNKYSETGRPSDGLIADRLTAECEIYYNDYKRLSATLNSLIKAELELSGGYIDTDSAYPLHDREE